MSYSKCPKCKGHGRVKREQSDTFLHAVTFGFTWLLEKAIESDRDDDRFWKDCNICRGRGYIKD
jgi:DnaJ-class molecular chaperone